MAKTITTQQKNSSIELLRILSIFFVVIHHIIVVGFDICGYNSSFIPSTNYYVGVFLNSLVVCGVNCFVLISGFYGIKNPFRKVLILIVTCFLLGLLTIGITAIFPKMGGEIYRL